MNPVICTDLVVHPAFSSKKEASSDREMYDLFMKKSFKAQIADNKRLNPYVSIPIPSSIITEEKPGPFNGSCKDCLREIKETVDSSLDNMNYNGLQPFLKIIDKIEKGNSCAIIDSHEETAGGTCVGQSHVLLENIKKNHGITGSLGAAQDSIGYLHHAAVIIECMDGVVLVDTRSCPEDRLFAIPFGTSYQHGKHTCFTAALQQGQQPPLTQTWLNDEGKEVDRHEFYTNIANADDSVMKKFIADTSTDWMPIATYKKDGTGGALKDVKIFLQEEKIILKNHITNTKKTISFESIQESGCLHDLEEFMGVDFNFTPQEIHSQIIKVATQSKRIIAFFEGARREFFQKLEEADIDRKLFL